MFPIKDHNPSSTFPFVTYALMAINIIVFLLYFPGQSEESIWQFFQVYALQPAEIVAGESMLTLLTAMFLHGGWMHLGGNMLFLYIFGDNLEHRMGHVKYLGFYILAGIAASYAQIIADPTSMIPNVGASGAIAGIMGGYLFLFPKAKIDVLMIMGAFTRVQSMPAFAMLGYWFLLQIISGTSAMGNEGGGVAYWAHAGGFLAGLVMVMLLKKSKKNI